MTRESLSAKYGNAVVMGVDAELIKGALKDGYTRPDEAFYRKDGRSYPLGAVIRRE